MNQITIKNTTYRLPIFLPDATMGVVRNLSSQELSQVGIEGIVINSYHLMNHPGLKTLKKAKGIQNLMNFHGLTVADSGGFQLFSLIHQNPQLGKITDQGLVLYSGIKKQTKTIFTPEKSIQLQFAINSDIMICLDDFTPPGASAARRQESVDRTISWAVRSKKEFEAGLKKAKYPHGNKQRPLLFAVIQGYDDQKLRQYCAHELLKIGFDGYGLGGWPFDQKGNFDYRTCLYNASLTPEYLPKFALGVGSPQNIVDLFQMGYRFFDCVLPTRDARHQRLYILTDEWKKIDLKASSAFNASLSLTAKIPKTKNKITLQPKILTQPAWYQYLYINRALYQNDFQPISCHCSCFTCQHYTRAYLHHLFKIKEGLAWRLATIHNLSFYSQLIKKLRKIT